MSAAAQNEKLVVAMAVYPGLTLLDLIGPLTVLAYHARIHLVYSSLDPVASDQGIAIVPNCLYADCPEKLDILFVPGGDGVMDAIFDENLLSFLRTRGEKAAYVTSVCTGALILAAAGLLQGYRATTHWAWRDVLDMLGAKSSGERVVIDGNRVTGAGVSAGIDFGLTLLAHLRGEKQAKMRQLMIEYDPQPPFDTGTPEKAGEELLDMVGVLLNLEADRKVVIDGLARKAN